MVRAEPSGAKIMTAWVKEHGTVTVRYAIRLPLPESRKKAVGRDGLM